VLSEAFIRDPKFDAKTHLEAIFQAEVGSEPIDVAIWFNAATSPYIRERRWHPTQMLEEHPNGALTLSMTVRGINDVKRWVMGYGQGAKVLKPKELVEMVKQELAGMVKHYSSPE
jgi:predicted DNA-binding transcriptional regulator YafY